MRAGDKSGDRSFRGGGTGTGDSFPKPCLTWGDRCRGHVGTGAAGFGDSVGCPSRDTPLTHPWERWDPDAGLADLYDRDTIRADLLDRMGTALPSWHADAACRGVPAVTFFPRSGQPTEAALELCRSCPVNRDIVSTRRSATPVPTTASGPAQHPSNVERCAGNAEPKSAPSRAGGGGRRDRARPPQDAALCGSTCGGWRGAIPLRAFGFARQDPARLIVCGLGSPRIRPTEVSTRTARTRATSGQTRSLA